MTLNILKDLNNNFLSRVVISKFFSPIEGKKVDKFTNPRITSSLEFIFSFHSRKTGGVAKGAEAFFCRCFDKRARSRYPAAFRPLMMHEAGFVGMAERGTIRHKHSAIFIVGFPGERARIRASGWNCQKSFELRYPSSWNSSRAARGSRLKPENQARYLRNEKGSCGPQPLSLWNNLPPDEIVCITFSPTILQYKWDPNSSYYCIIS